jgi:predicted amidohydrolase YtcJ
VNRSESFTEVTAGPAELVITGAAVYTVDAARSWADHVAIRGGRIAARGVGPPPTELIGPDTRLVDLPGRMVLPGFQDAHVHPPEAGLAKLRCELHGLGAAKQYIQAVQRYAAAHPDEPWIVGSGWSMDAFPGGVADRRDLDRAVPGRPVFLESRDGHSAWVSSAVLEMAGVTAATPDPSGGRIERDAAGEPIGTLQEHAIELVSDLLPETTPDEWQVGLRLAQAELHSLGITAWQDAIIRPATFAAYRAVEARGELSARVVGALLWDRDRGEEQVEELIELRAASLAEPGRFRATAVKIFQDGVVENLTAAVLEPYLGEPGDSRGIGMIDPVELGRVVTRLDRERFQVHFHAIGDRAVREALDAFQEARDANGPRDSRHHIAHIQLIHPDDLPRFRRLGVVANGQPYWACMDGYMRDLTIPVLGPERAARQYPFASLLRHGAVLALGSDWSVSTPNPLLEMEVAVNRVLPEDRGSESFLPEERLTLAQGLAAFTAGSSFVNQLDHLTGTIEVGKAADLVVLDRNLFEPDAGPIGDAKVLVTLVDGRAVFADPDIGW